MSHINQASSVTKVPHIKIRNLMTLAHVRTHKILSKRFLLSTSFIPKGKKPHSRSWLLPQVSQYWVVSLNYQFLDKDFHNFRTNLQSELVTFILMEKNLHKMAALAKTESK